MKGFSPLGVQLTAANTTIEPIAGLEGAETSQEALEALAARPSGGSSEPGAVPASSVTVEPIEGVTATDGQGVLAELAARGSGGSEGSVVGEPIAFVRPAVYWSVQSLNLAVPNLQGGLRAPLAFTIPHQEREAIATGATGFGVLYAAVNVGGPELFDGIGDLVSRANAAAIAVGLPPDTFYVDVTSYGVPSLVVQSSALNPAETAAIPTEDGAIANWAGGPNIRPVILQTSQIDAGQVYLTAGKTITLTEKLNDLDRTAAKVATVQAGLAEATRFASTIPAVPGGLVGTVVLGNDISTIFATPVSALGINSGDTYHLSEYGGPNLPKSFTVSDANTTTILELLNGVGSQNTSIDLYMSYDVNDGQYRLGFRQTSDQGAVEHVFYGPNSEFEGAPAFGIGGRSDSLQPIKTTPAIVSTTNAAAVRTADGSNVEAKIAALEAAVAALQAA